MSDKGTFNNPVVVSDFETIGRVDIAFINENESLVSYIETNEFGTYLRCKKVHKNGSISKVITVSEISSSRSTGVPQLEVLNNFAYFVWTVSEHDKNQIESVKINLSEI